MASRGEKVASPRLKSPSIESPRVHAHAKNSNENSGENDNLLGDSQKVPNDLVDGIEPHFIVNLDTNNEEASAALPYSCPSPVTQMSMMTQSGGAKPDTANPDSGMNGNGSTMNVDVKVRSYVGSDNYSIVTSLCKLFPLLPRNRIDRVFTIHMFDYNSTFKALTREHEDLQKKKTVKLVKAEETNDPRYDIATPQSNNAYYPELMKTVSSNGRGVSGALGMFYRRVEVDSNGVVLSSPSCTNEILKRMVVGTVSRPRNGRKRGEDPIINSGSPQQLEEIKPAIAGMASRKSTAMPSLPILQPTKMEAPQVVSIGSEAPEVENGAKFFRSKRVTSAETKKRDYASRELASIQQPTTTGNGAANFMANLGVAVRNSRGGNTNVRKSLGGMGASSDVVMQDLMDTERLEELGMTMSPEEREELLNFFNTAEEPEFFQIPGCSVRNASTLVKMRPFPNISVLIARLKSTRNLSVEFIASYRDLITMRAEVGQLMEQCQEISQKIARHLGILFKNSTDMPTQKDLERSLQTLADETADLTTISKQPALLSPDQELKPYQLLGLNWLNMLHHENVNGILADEMGLGKTIQTIAFLAHLHELGHRGPHLIMCPSSLLENWAREIKTWCGDSLSVLVYSGPTEARKAIRMKIYDQNCNEEFCIFLTSYTVGTSTLEDRALLKKLSFHYGIFDEAHMLKNLMSQRFRNLMNIQVKRRILLTGTPVQNNLIELMSLLAFVMPQIFYDNYDLLKNMFRVHHQQQGQLPATSRSAELDKQRLQQATELLKPFCLRRLKADVLSQLPPKIDEVVMISMTKGQAAGHANMIEKFREMRNMSKVEIAAANKKRKTATSNGSAPTVDVVNQLMEMRKMSNHLALASRIHYQQDTLGMIAQTLHKDKSHAKANVEYIMEDLMQLSDADIHRVCRFYDCLTSFALDDEYILKGSGKLGWMDGNVPKLLAEQHRILVFSQFVIMLNLIEDWARSRDLKFVRLDGNTPVSDRQTIIDTFNQDNSIGLFLLSTRAGGLGINLTSADTVILHDISFNPYQEKQAEDRCHRVGQTKPVRVIRLITEGTVEENILRIARDKLTLEQSLTRKAKQTTSNGAENKPASEEDEEATVSEEMMDESSTMQGMDEADAHAMMEQDVIYEDESGDPLDNLRALQTHAIKRPKTGGNSAHVPPADTAGLDESEMQNILNGILDN